MLAKGKETMPLRQPTIAGPFTELDRGKPYFSTQIGQMVLGNSLDVLARLEPQTVDLVMTSPPFGLVRKKGYGNADAEEYVDWFRPFGKLFKYVLKDKGSLVIDIGGSWIPGQPTRSLYHFKLLIMLCEELGFHLAQDFYWWNPSRLPTPAEWVTVRRIRVKDAINCIWWLSPTPWPRASNRRVLQPYSPSMRHLITHGYRAKKRPSGHDISTKFRTDNGAAIPPNLIALPNTESNSYYLRYCSQNSIEPHPARYPAGIPEYFIRMLSDAGDLIVDPFAGSCVTGEVAERLKRKWLCIEMKEDYLKGAVGRFKRSPKEPKATQSTMIDITQSRATRDDDFYKVARPGILWSDEMDCALASDGGQKRPAFRNKKSSDRGRR